MRNQSKKYTVQEYKNIKKSKQCRKRTKRIMEEYKSHKNEAT